MTCVPERPIGQVLDVMADEQVEQAVVDLKTYISELRDIPNKTTGFQICNSEGGGILDWRTPIANVMSYGSKLRLISTDI